MAPPIALTLLPTCAAAAGCGTSLLVPTPRAPTAKPNASSRPPCANGLTPGPTITPSNAPTRFPPGSTPTTIIAFIAASAIALLSLAFPRTTCCNPTDRLSASFATLAGSQLLPDTKIPEYCVEYVLAADSSGDRAERGCGGHYVDRDDLRRHQRERRAAGVLEGFQSHRQRVAMTFARDCDLIVRWRRGWSDQDLDRFGKLGAQGARFVEVDCGAREGWQCQAVAAKIVRRDCGRQIALVQDCKARPAGGQADHIAIGGFQRTRRVEYRQQQVGVARRSHRALDSDA